jgi:ammonia channel protein AmtB
MVGLATTVNAGDTAFVLICAALVALMTPALAFFYGRLVRRKNFLAIMMQSFISMGVVTTIWVFFGYSLAFSGDIGGIFGNLHWAALTNVGHLPGPWAPNIPAQAHFVYQEMFAIITPALITGAFADRVKFKSYLWFLVLWSILVYIPFVHWIWGGGWLMQHGVLDFAGGLVVHVSAGFAALASVCYFAVIFKEWMKWDDALDVWAAHGVGGFMGTILLGVFALKSVNPAGADGLITGNWSFFGWQVLATVVVAAYAFVATYLILKLINMFGSIRVPDAVELRGLDETEFGEAAYDLN